MNHPRFAHMLCVVAIFLLHFQILHSQDNFKWSQVLGTENIDDVFEVVEDNQARLFVAGRNASLLDFDYQGNLALFSDDGTLLWEKIFGGSQSDEFFTATTSTDGHFVAAGRTSSTDGDLADIGVIDGISDGWVVKVNANGEILWQNTYGLEGQERIEAIQSTPDGGFVIAGHTTSTVFATGAGLAWAMKIDGDGNEIWTRRLGNQNVQLIPGNEFLDVAVDENGDYLFAGQTSAFPQGNDIPQQNIGSRDGWLVKLNDAGDVLWERVYGGTAQDDISSIELADNGDIFLAGFSFPEGPTIPPGIENFDGWVLRLTSAGDKIWEKIMGGNRGDFFRGMSSTSDGGVILGGSNSSDPTFGDFGNSDAWLVKLNGQGEVEWESKLGGSSSDRVWSVVETSSLDYACAAWTSSSDGDVGMNAGSRDGWVFSIQNPAIPVETDVALSLTTTDLNPDAYETTSLVLTVLNTGIDPASGLMINMQKPEEVVYVGNDQYTASQGEFNIWPDETWDVGTLQPNESATLTVNYFLLTDTPFTVYAQVTASNDPDTDSTPGNGTPPNVNEDDEVIISINGGTPPLCSITTSAFDFICDDGNTPAPGDDLFGFSLLAENTTASSGFSVLVQESNELFENQTYNSTLTFGMYPISDGDKTLLLTDNDDPSCTETILISPPTPCSNQGEVIDLELSLQQGTVNPDQWSSYSVTATLTNTGTISASDIEVVVSKPDGVVYAGGNEFVASSGSFQAYGDQIWRLNNLAPGASATLTVNYFLTASSAPVVYSQVLAAGETDLDSTPGNGTPPLPDEDDEAATGSTSPTPKADLVLENFSLPGSAESGDIIGYSFDLKNVGDAAASGDFTIKTYFSSDNILSNDDIFDGLIPTGNIASGQVITDVIGASQVPDLPSGNYYVILLVDADDDIDESNEINNTISSLIAIQSMLPNPGEYCQVESDFPWHEWISEIKFTNQYDWTSGKSTYSDFTNEAPALIYEQGTQAGFIFNITYSYWTFPVYFHYYIDFNQNGVFEQSELGSVSADAIAPGNNVVLSRGASKQIPQDALTGNTRLRVIASRNPIIDACTNIAFGEIEDYPVLIVEGNNSSNRLQPAVNDFMVFPNPADEILNIDLSELPGTEIIILYNSLGHEIRRYELDVQRGHEDFSIPTADLTNGTYLLRLSGSDFKARGKVVVVQRGY